MKNLLIIWSVLSSISITAMSQVVVVPFNGPPPTLASVTINNCAGDQYDPYLSGDWISYTSINSIRYYNFATNTDAEIPIGPSDRDLLSAISGSKNSFLARSSTKTAFMVFDRRVRNAH